MMNNYRRGFLSLMLTVLMVATSFFVIATAPAAAASGPVSESVGGTSDATGFSSIVSDPEMKIDSVLKERLTTARDPMMVYVVVNDREAVNAYLESAGLPTIKSKEIPNMPTVQLMTLDAKQIHLLAANPGVSKIMMWEKPVVDPTPVDPDVAAELSRAVIEGAPPAVEDYDVDYLHGATDAWSMGWTGAGVNIALVDDGFDMAHPDLQGQQARYTDTASPYYGWPIAYDDYAAQLWANNQSGGWVSDTSTLVQKYGSYVYFDGSRYKVDGLTDVNGSPVNSVSGWFHIGYHPDANLQYIMGGPIAVLVVDSSSDGVYDTVYVDVTRDFDFTNDKACTRGNEISYFDSYDSATGVDDYSMWNAGDGYADYSGGMVYWISNGSNVLPGSDWLLGATWTPSSGYAVAFMGQFNFNESHGTMTSSAALATGSSWLQLAGMAPGAKLICIPFTGNIVNSWLFAEYGADGMLGTGDEANIVSNSYGWSETAIDAGYEELDSIAMAVDLIGFQTLWMWSAGNGGPGYGQSHSVTDPMSVRVGAGTTMQYRYYLGSESTYDYTKWGDVIPFSNSGPSRMGKLNAEIIASGAYSIEPAPLNEVAYGGLGNGGRHYQLGSGTSHAAPTVAGGAALGYQSFHDDSGGWPEIDFAKAFLIGSADDMHYDPFKQGAGWLDAYNFAAAMPAYDGVITFSYPGWTDPNFWKATWEPGTMYGGKYTTMPNFLRPGEYDNTGVFWTYSLSPDFGTSRDFNVSSEILLRSGSDTINVTTVDTDSVYIDITDLIPAGTDLLKVTMYSAMSQYDPELDYQSDVQYWLELHDWVDENGDGAMNVTGDEWELYRYTVDGADSNYNQVMLKDPLDPDRLAGRLIVRVRPYFGAAPDLDFKLQLDYYEMQTFPWVQFRMYGSGDPWTSSLDFTLIGGMSTAQWETNISVPIDAPVGMYDAAIYVTTADRVQCVPIVINVPADDYQFEFGGLSYFDTPYSNNVTGESDRGWRFEVGDWREYWALPTDPWNFPDFGSSLVVTVNWTELPTDTNAHVLAPLPAIIYGDDWVYDLPFGPHQVMVPIASSDEKYLGAGTFGVYTSTGGPKEVIAAPNTRTMWGSFGFTVGMCEYYSMLYTPVPGPILVLTRTPVMSGSTASDTLEGFTKWITVSDWGPAQISIESAQPGDPASPGYVPLEDSIPAWYDIGVAGTVDARGGGIDIVSGQTTIEPIWQDALSGSSVEALANAAFTQPVTVGETNLLRVAVQEVANCLDIDLGLWYDANQNGVADLSERYWYVGVGGSTESMTLEDPMPGQYLVKVLGYSVTGSPGYFALTVQVGIPDAVIVATDMEATASAGEHWFNITYSLPARAGIYSGAATFGFMGAADMFSIPVTINVIDEGVPVIENVVPADGAAVDTNAPTVEFDLNDSVEFYSGLNPSSITVAIDGVDWTYFAAVDGNHVTLVPPFAISEGTHTVYIEASDMYGNWADPVLVMFEVNSAIEAFAADFVDPTSMSAIPDGSTVALDEVTLEGVTDPNAEVVISTPYQTWVTQALPDGTFSAEMLSLIEGVNVFTIVTTNDAGVSKTMYKTIISDMVCALIVDPVESPVAQADVTIGGVTEMGASVTVDGGAASVDSTGVWSMDVTLSEGANTLTVEATDAVGNTNTVVVSIVLDTTAPTLSITAPAADTHVSEASVVVAGTTEAGAKVYVDGVLADMISTTGWQAMVVLAEGNNTVTVTAQDALGNIVSMTRVVVYDPPYATPDNLNSLHDQLQNEIDQLNDTTQHDLSNVDARVDDANSFASMLLYLMIGLFAVAVVMIVVVWHTLNGKIGGGKSEGHSMEEVSDEPPAPSDVEKEFEQLEREIDKEGR